MHKVDKIYSIFFTSAFLSDTGVNTMITFVSNLLLFALLPPAFSWISPHHIHVFVGMLLPCLTNYYVDHHSQLWSDPWNSSNISFSRLRQSLLKMAINCINKLFIKGLISKQLNLKKIQRQLLPKNRLDFDTKLKYDIKSFPVIVFRYWHSWW